MPTTPRLGETDSMPGVEEPQPMVLTVRRAEWGALGEGRGGASDGQVELRSTEPTETSPASCDSHVYCDTPPPVLPCGGRAPSLSLLLQAVFVARVGRFSSVRSSVGVAAGVLERENRRGSRAHAQPRQQGEHGTKGEGNNIVKDTRGGTCVVAVTSGVCRWAFRSGPNGRGGSRPRHAGHERRVEASNCLLQASERSCRLTTAHSLR